MRIFFLFEDKQFWIKSQILPFFYKKELVKFYYTDLRLAVYNADGFGGTFQNTGYFFVCHSQIVYKWSF